MIVLVVLVVAYAGLCVLSGAMGYRSTDATDGYAGFLLVLSVVLCPVALPILLAYYAATWTTRQHAAALKREGRRQELEVAAARRQRAVERELFGG